MCRESVRTMKEIKCDTEKLYDAARELARERKVRIYVTLETCNRPELDMIDPMLGYPLNFIDTEVAHVGIHDGQFACSKWIGDSSSSQSHFYKR